MVKVIGGIACLCNPGPPELVRPGHYAAELWHRLYREVRRAPAPARLPPRYTAYPHGSYREVRRAPTTFWLPPGTLLLTNTHSLPIPHINFNPSFSFSTG